MPTTPPHHHDPTSLPHDDLFTAYLHSLTLTNPNLTLDAVNNTLSVRPTTLQQTQTVSVVSGSARRFDPHIASFVGPGLLTACLAGSDASSDHNSNAVPATDAVEHVRAAIQDRALTMRNVLFIVPPHRDRDEEEIASRAGLSARARDLSMQFEQLTAPSTQLLDQIRKCRRTHGAGLPILLKICSATAARGYSLQEVLRVGKLVVKNLLSVGWHLHHESRDGREGESSRAELDRAAAKEPELSSRVHRVLDLMLSPSKRFEDFVEVNSNEVVLLVSGYNGLTRPEMEAVTSEVVKQLAQSWNIRPVRIYTESASVLSTLGRTETHKRGFAITILNVCNTDIGGPSMIELLDAPTEAVGWAALVQGPSWEVKYTRLWEHNVQSVKPSGLKCDVRTIWLGATNGARAVEAFAKNNRLAGDDRHESWYGDPAAPPHENIHAQDMWNCARGAIQAFSSVPSLSEDVVILISDMLWCTRSALDSPFGALCSIFLSALMQSFQTQSETATESNVGVWIYALEQAWLILLEYARHRTAMAGTLDALDRFVTTLHSTGNMLKAAKAAQPHEGMVDDLGAQLMCAFFAGLVGHLDGRIEDSAAGGLKTEVSDQTLQKETSSVPTSEKMEPAPTSAEEEPSGTSNAAAVPVESVESSTKEGGNRPEVGTFPGTEPTPANNKVVPESEVEQPALTDEGQVTEASRDAIVDALQIKPSDFDAAMESIRSRTPVPLPTRQIEETTLLDMVRQQIASLGVSSSKEEAASAQKDPDEEEYELV